MNKSRPLTQLGKTIVFLSLIVGVIVTGYSLVNPIGISNEPVVLSVCGVGLLGGLAICYFSHKK